MRERAGAVQYGTAEDDVLSRSTARGVGIAHQVSPFARAVPALQRQFAVGLSRPGATGSWWGTVRAHHLRCIQYTPVCGFR
jgi:hypothetical protein